MKKADRLDLFDITGKAAIVTGATGAFGSVAAKTLAAAGAKVMLTGRNLTKLTEIAGEIGQAGGEAAFSAGDPIIHADVTRVVKATVDAFGGIDILITAAGLNTNGPIHQLPDEDWQMSDGRQRARDVFSSARTWAR